MEWMDMLRAEARLKKTPDERESERYIRMDIDFSDGDYSGCVMKKIGAFGDFLSKATYSGNVGDATLRLGHRHSAAIHMSEFKKTYAEYDTLYLTTSDTSGHLVLYVGRAFSGEIEPSGGTETKLLNVGGAEIDPVQDKRFKKHTMGMIGLTEQTTTDVAQKLTTTSTKVKWAVIEINLKISEWGDSTLDPHHVTPVHGQKLAEGSYITVEYADLSEIYICNFTASEKTKYSVVYVKEA